MIGSFMRKKPIAYTEGEIGKIRVVKDFLPPPDQLVLREENAKLRDMNSTKRSR